MVKTTRARQLNPSAALGVGVVFACVMALSVFGMPGASANGGLIAASLTVASDNRSQATATVAVDATGPVHLRHAVVGTSGWSDTLEAQAPQDATTADPNRSVGLRKSWRKGLVL